MPECSITLSLNVDVIGDGSETREAYAERLGNGTAEQRAEFEKWLNALDSNAEIFPSLEEKVVVPFLIVRTTKAVWGLLKAPETRPASVRAAYSNGGEDDDEGTSEE